MNSAILEGYIKIGKYDGVRQTSTGKEVTRFTLSSPKGKNDEGKSEYEYFTVDCWHDKYGTQNGVIDGRYALVQCTPKTWKKDNKSGVSFTANKIWLAPDKDENKPQNTAQNAGVYDEDIPF